MVPAAARLQCSIGSLPAFHAGACGAGCSRQGLLVQNNVDGNALLRTAQILPAAHPAQEQGSTAAHLWPCTTRLQHRSDHRRRWWSCRPSELSRWQSPGELDSWQLCWCPPGTLQIWARSCIAAAESMNMSPGAWLPAGRQRKCGSGRSTDRRAETRVSASCAGAAVCCAVGRIRVLPRGICWDDELS